MFHLLGGFFWPDKGVQPLKMYNVLNDVPGKNQVDVENLNIKLNKKF